MQKFSDQQLSEVTSIFRNNSKPPKTLWIEKNPYDSIRSHVEESLITSDGQHEPTPIRNNSNGRDICMKNDKSHSTDDCMPTQQHESEYLIFERHF